MVRLLSESLSYFSRTETWVGSAVTAMALDTASPSGMQTEVMDAAPGNCASGTSFPSTSSLVWTLSLM